jgi:hypothetical protein
MAKRWQLLVVESLDQYIAPRETLWCQFFLDHSQWWDCRLEKVNARDPDFKHKNMDDGL